MLIIIVHLIHLSSFLFLRTECLIMLVKKRADVSRRICSCIDVEQVKEKPWRGGGSRRGSVEIQTHNNQPDKDKDKDKDKDEDEDEDEDK
jgi:hypothetical protein